MTPTAIRAGILGSRVGIGGEDAGHVTGVLVHPESGPIGLEVSGDDRARRFLPLVAATFVDDVVDVPSPLLLVDSCDAYIGRGAVLCRDAESVAGLTAARADVSNALATGKPRG